MSARQNETPAPKMHGHGSRAFVPLLAAFAMSLVLTGSLAEKILRNLQASAKSPDRTTNWTMTWTMDLITDWISLGAAAAVAIIMLGVIIASWKKTVTLGDGEITVFDLETDDSIPGESATKRPKSIGPLAQSVRQAASEVTLISDRLASAHESGSGTPGTLKALLDSQSDALAQIDKTNNEALRLGEESAILNESLASSVGLATLHANHGTDHAKSLELLTTMTNDVLKKAGDAALQARGMERDRDSLILSSQESLAATKQILGTVDSTLIAFRDGAKKLEEQDCLSSDMPSDMPSDRPSDTLPTKQSALPSGLDAVIRDTKNFAAHLAKISECLQLTRMNQSLQSGTANRMRDRNLEDAENMLREARDAVSHLERKLDREAENTIGTLNDLRRDLVQAKLETQILNTRTKKLSAIAGDLGHALGQIRTGMQSEASRMDHHLTRCVVKSIHPHGANAVILDLVEAASKIAHGNNHLAISGQRLQIDGCQLLAKLEDLRITSAAGRGHSQRLQQSTGATSAKVEAVVNLAHTLIRSEDSATRKSTAGAARFAIQDKVKLIDRFALRVIEMEDRVKRMKGPSPAIDRSELAKLPEFEFPVQ